jgi:hypothetical protein
MAKVDFSHGEKTREFLLTLHEVFPLLEHFLKEDDWATIVFFLSEKKIDLNDLRKIRKALQAAEEKFGNYYPSFMPPKPRHTGRYAFEGVLAVAVYNIVQMLMHLNSLADNFIALLEHGQNPNHL